MKSAVSIGLLSVMTAVSFAATKTQNLSSFNRLTVRDGFNVTVGCAKIDKIVITGAKKELGHTQVTMDGHHLEIERRDSVGIDRDVSLAIYTTKPLNAIHVSQGIMLTVDACALNPKKFSMSIKKGAKAIVSGKTDNMNLYMNQGAIFNTKATALMVKDLMIKGSAGIRAYVCGAKSISGSISKGAVIYTGNNTNTNNLKTSWGALARDC